MALSPRTASGVGAGGGGTGSSALAVASPQSCASSVVAGEAVSPWSFASLLATAREAARTGEQFTMVSTLLWTASSVVFVAVRFAYEVNRLHEYRTTRSPDDKRDPVDNAGVWILVTMSVCLAVLISVMVMSVRAGQTTAQGRAIFFIQCVVSAMVITYAEGGTGWGTETFLFVFPAMATSLEIPVELEAPLVGAFALEVVLIIIDRGYDFGFRHFVTDPLPPVHAVLVVFVVLCTAAVFRLATGQLFQERHRRKTLAEFYLAITETMVQLNVTAAQKLLQETTALDPKDRLATGLRSLVDNLAVYRPYLPFALVRSEDARFEDEVTDDDEDERESRDDDVESQGSNSHETEKRNSVFRRRRSTIMHVYVANFPTQDIAAASDMAARFLEVVVPKVMLFNGIIDQLLPNSIVVSFNCHVPCVLHEQQACRCALSIASELQQFPNLVFCIALAAGYNLVGSCGVATTRARVVVGESVDLAMRLPSLATSFVGSRIIMTAELCTSGCDAVPIDHVAPRWLQAGRSKEITLYELRAGLRDSEQLPLTNAYNTAFAATRMGDTQGAIQMWRNYCERDPTDNQARRLLSICEHYQSLGKSLVPFVRNEQQWEMLEPAPVTSRAGAPGPGTSMTAAANTTLHHHIGPSVTAEASTAQAQALITALQMRDGVTGTLNEEGLFGVIIAEEEPADQSPEAVDASVPKNFEDAAHNRWQRSEKLIGTGAFSSVYLALGSDGNLVAVKCFSLTGRNSSSADLAAEVNTLSTLRNDYIVGYVSCAMTANHFIILMEYVSGGSLHQLLQQFGPLPLPAVRRYLRDVLKGLRFLHESGSSHCDIKPHNVLLSNDGMCKLSDFGSCVNQRAESNDDGGDAVVRGTSWYIAPEVAKGVVSNAGDIWSLGITVIEMITGNIPWNFKGTEATFMYQLGRDDTMMPPIPPQLPEGAADFCRACLQRDPTKRPTAQQLQISPFLI